MLYPALRKRNGYYTRKIYSKFSYSKIKQVKYKGINFGYLLRYYFYCDIYTSTNESLLVSYDENIYNINKEEVGNFLMEIFYIIINMPMGYYEYLELKSNL